MDYNKKSYPVTVIKVTSTSDGQSDSAQSDGKWFRCLKEYELLAHIFFRWVQCQKLKTPEPLSDVMEQAKLSVS